MAHKDEVHGSGLLLDMPGAPESWHHIPDLGVWVHPRHPLPLGGPGEPLVKDAREWAKQDGTPVQVVRVDDMDAARHEYGNHIRQLRGLAPQIRLEAAGDEALLADAQTTRDKE